MTLGSSLNQQNRARIAPWGTKTGPLVPTVEPGVVPLRQALPSFNGRLISGCLRAALLRHRQ